MALLGMLLLTSAVSFAAAAPYTASVTPATTIKYAPFQTVVDASVNSLSPSGKEWNATDLAGMLCTINSTDAFSAPVCPTTGGKEENVYFLGPLLEAGGDLGTKTIYGMSYAHKQCDGNCSSPSTTCTICVLMLSNKATNGQLIPIDVANAGNTFIKIGSTNVVDGADNGGPWLRFIYLQGTPIGYEACMDTAVLSSLNSDIPTGASSLKFDMHFDVVVGGAGKTARLRKGSGTDNGFTFGIEACNDTSAPSGGGVPGTPSCTQPTVALTGTTDVTTGCGSTTATYQVQLSATNANVAATVMPAGCSLTTDGRDGSGNGLLTYTCVGLQRASMTSLVFGVAGSLGASGCTQQAANVTVPVTPSALAGVTVAAAATADQVCSSSAVDGVLAFTATTSSAVAAGQLSAVVERAGGGNTTCAVSGSGTSFSVECSGLAVGSYQLYLSVANTANPSCPSTATVPGSSVSVYSTPNFVLSPQPTQQSACAAAAAPAFTFAVAVAGAALGVNDTSLCSVSGSGGAYSVACPSVPSSAGVQLVAYYGSSGDNCSTTLDVALPVAVDPQVTFTSVTPTRDVVCPSEKGNLAFAVTTGVATASLSAVLVTAGSSPVAVANCSAPGTGGTSWSVTCGGVGPGTYAIQVTATSASGCTYSTTANDPSQLVTVTEYSKPSIVVDGGAAPTRQAVCSGNAASFQFPVAAAGASSLAIDDARCSVTGGYSVNCTGITGDTNITLTAAYGDAAAGDNCAVVGVVTLPVDTDSRIDVTSVTPASDMVCPLLTGTLTFDVSTSSNAQSLSAVLVTTASPQVDVMACSAPGSGKSSWSVECTDVPPGTYALKVTATSASGCDYTTTADSPTQLGSVVVYAMPVVTVNSGAPLPKQDVRAGGTGSFTFPVTAAGATGLTVDDTTHCRVTGGYTVTCSNLTETTNVTLSAEYGNATIGEVCRKPVDVVMPVFVDTRIDVTSLTVAGDMVCPSQVGTLTFAAATNVNAASLSAVLVDTGSPPVEVTNVTCGVTGGGMSWSVECDDVPLGTYALKITGTSAVGFDYTTVADDASQLVTVAEYTTPSIVVNAATSPSLVTVCPGRTATFNFGVTATGAAGLSVDDTTHCGVTGGYTVSCTGLNETTSVTLTAAYGNATTGDDCSTYAGVSLLVATDATIDVTSVTPTSDQVCPARDGTVAFSVVTSRGAASLSAVLVNSSSPSDVVANCSAPGSSQSSWTVTCTGVPVGTFALKLTVTSANGCEYTSTADGPAQLASVSMYAAPTVVVNSGSLLATQDICSDAAASFQFPVTAAGSTGLTVDDTAHCDVTGGYTVTCSNLTESASITLTAAYGDASAGDDCTTTAVMSLPVAQEAQISVTSVTPASDKVCPLLKGTLTFDVSTSSNAQSLSAVLVTTDSPPAAVGANCSAPGSDNSSWTVTCTNVPPGTYALKVNTTSTLGCTRTTVANGNSQIGSVVEYVMPVVSVDAATKPVLQTICGAGTASFSFGVSASGASGLLVDDTAHCSVTGGYTVACSGLAQTTNITLTALYGNASLGDDCRTSAAVSLPVLIGSQIPIASVTPASDMVCPSVKGTLTFAVATTSAAKSLSAVLVTTANPSVEVMNCSGPGTNLSSWTVTCSNVPPGSYALKTTTTSVHGCKLTAVANASSQLATVAEYTKPTVTVNGGTPVALKSICAGSSAAFSFPVTAPGSSSLSATAGCTVAGAGGSYTVSCSGLTATATVNLTAAYGNATTGDNCRTSATASLPVTTYPTVEVSTVAPTSDKVCPSTGGTPSFTLTTTALAASVTARLLSLTSPPVEVGNCSVPGTNKSSWAVLCPNAAVGTYGLKVTVTSPQGCVVSSTNRAPAQQATVTEYSKPTISFTQPAAQSTCAGGNASFTFPVIAAGTTGLTASDGRCAATGASGSYSLSCSGITNTTSVTIAALYGDAAAGDNCTVTAVASLPVTSNGGVSVTSVTPVSDQVCHLTKGTLTFAVATSGAARSISAVVVTNTAPFTEFNATCTSPGGNQSSWTVTCSNVNVGAYALKVTATSAAGCSSTTVASASGQQATVTEYTKPSIVVNGGSALAAQGTCGGGPVSFTFPVTAAGATGLTANDPRCTVTGSGGSYSVACSSVTGTTSVTFAARYGNAAAGDNCTTTADVSLPVGINSAVNVTSVTPTSDQVCPLTKGTVTFVVATSDAAALLSASLVASGNPAVDVMNCTAPGNNIRSWTVTCSNVNVGTYALKVTATSAQGCSSTTVANASGQLATVTEYTKPSIVVNGGSALAAQGTCGGGPVSFTFPVTAAGATGLTASDNRCTVTGSGGSYSVACSGVTGTTSVTLAAAYGNAATSDNCSATAQVSLPVGGSTAVNVTSVTPTSDQVCPLSKGSLTFTVVTSDVAQSLSAVLGTSTNVEVMNCSAPGSSLSRWTVTCSNVDVGTYALKITTTSGQGCSSTTVANASGQQATVTEYIQPTIIVNGGSALASQGTCGGGPVSFTFPVTAAGATGLTASDKRCTVTGSGGSYSVACSGVTGTTSVTLAAAYGNTATSDNCSATAQVSLPVGGSTAVNVTSVTPSSSPICPASSSGTVTFAVVTTPPAQSLSGVLVTSGGTEVMNCSAPGSSLSSWTVTCTNVAVGSYGLKVVATSLSGCNSVISPALSAPAAIVSKYAYSVLIGGDAAGSDVTAAAICSNQTASQDVVVSLSADLAGAALTVTPGSCVRNALKPGVTYTCSGLRPNTVTTVTVTAVKNGCSLTDSALVTVPLKNCSSGGGSPINGFSCFSRTIGYWMNHGAQMLPWLRAMDAAKQPLKLWGKTFTAAAFTADNSQSNRCSLASPDALRFMCVPGSSKCPDSQLGRQCIAALINNWVTRDVSCGNANACFGTGAWSWVPARISQCCNPTSKPSATIMTACTNDMSNWNQDKSNVAARCLPASGSKANTQNVCTKYSDEYKAGASTCSIGYCAARHHRRSLLGGDSY